MRMMLLFAALTFTVDCNQQQPDSVKAIERHKPLVSDKATMRQLELEGKARLWDEHVEKEKAQLEENLRWRKSQEESTRKWDREHPNWWNNWGKGRDEDYDAEAKAVLGREYEPPGAGW